MSIILIDASSDSLLVSWPEAEGSAYKLEYRKANSTTFETLAEHLAATQVRKKHLQDESNAGFFFRLGVISDSAPKVTSWLSHADPFHLLSAQQCTTQMAAPTTRHAGSFQTLIIQWKSYSTLLENGASCRYELQLRENKSGEPWTTIGASLLGTSVRKKNLSSPLGYQFRVRPILQEIPFSPPSDPVVSLGLSQGVKQLFHSLENQSLLQQQLHALKLSDALGGKEFILIYVSAHWCGPCRQFTPQLVTWYKNMLRASNNNNCMEVVFLSADHSHQEFVNYYQNMPWLAIDYNDETARETLMAQLRVQGIPRLAVVDGRTGRVIEDNAVGKTLDPGRWRKLLSR
jgi:thiol-disulfide isomerase/thioredoxin